MDANDSEMSTASKQKSQQIRAERQQPATPFWSLGRFFFHYICEISYFPGCNMMQLETDSGLNPRFSKMTLIGFYHFPHVRLTRLNCA